MATIDERWRHLPDLQIERLKQERDRLRTRLGRDSGVARRPVVTRGRMPATVAIEALAGDTRRLVPPVQRGLSASHAGSIRRTAMTKVGRFVIDPRAGSYCYVTIDTGEKLLVSHEKTGTRGNLTVALLKLWGFSSESVFAASLDSPEGQALLARLTAGARAGSADATPLGALVHYLKDCETMAEVRAKCRALGPQDP